MLATTAPSLDGRVATVGVRPKHASVLPPLVAVKLLDQVRERIRYLHYSPRTEDVYIYWIRLFIRFHKLRHPRDLGAPEVEAFLSWLANARQVAPSTHKQALAALLFLYDKVLGLNLPWLKDIGTREFKLACRSS
jgi:Phage integrase, N-terminal SAM-like domain